MSISPHLIRKTGLSALLVLLLLSGVITGFFFRQQAYAASAVTINGATTFQTIDGFGASQAFGQALNVENNVPAGPQKQMLDLLYSPTTGAGLTILRNLLPSTAGDTIEPNGPASPTASPTYVPLGSSEGQIWFAQQAQTYGVTQLYGDAWSAPGFMKTNGSEANGGTLCGAPGAATCSTGDWRQAYANYLTQYAKDYASAGVPLTELGAFNELNFTASYSSMLMTPAQAADFVGTLGSTVKAAGLSPQIVCCDVLGWDTAQSYATGVESNTAANSTLNIFSSHAYSAPPTFPITGLGSRHVWQSEWGIFDAIDNNWDDGGQSDGFNWAQKIYTGLTTANLSAFLFWEGAEVNNTTANSYLVDYTGNTVVASARLWAFANFSRFIRPGAVRIGASSGDSNLQVSAYKNTNGTTSIVVLNSASNAITAAYSLQGTGVANGTTVTPYLTNSSSNTAQQATTSVSGGAFSATIPARSLVTYVLGGTSAVTPTPIPTVGTTPTPVPTVGTTPTPAPTVGTTPTPVSGASCSVHYAITTQWAGGFGASLTITNTGTTAINGWTLKFSFPNGQTITQLWNGSDTQSGSAVTITNASYNSSIPAGATLSSPPGFNGAWSGSNGPPTAFTLNGAACTVV